MVDYAIEQAQKGDWAFDFKPVFFLGLLGFPMRHLDPTKFLPGKFIHRFSLLEDETHELMSDRVRYAFLEVSRFDKPKEACRSVEDRFLFIFKNLSKFAERPELWDDPYFDELLDEAEYANMDMIQQREYLEAWMAKCDEVNTRNFARKEGLEKGREEGARQATLGVAKRMLEDKVPVETIAKYSGLSEEEINSL